MLHIFWIIALTIDTTAGSIIRSSMGWKRFFVVLVIIIIVVHFKKIIKIMFSITIEKGSFTAMSAIQIKTHIISRVLIRKILMFAGWRGRAIHNFDGLPKSEVLATHTVICLLM